MNASLDASSELSLSAPVTTLDSTELLAILLADNDPLLRTDPPQSTAEVRGDRKGDGDRFLGGDPVTSAADAVEVDSWCIAGEVGGG